MTDVLMAEIEEDCDCDRVEVDMVGFERYLEDECVLCIFRDFYKGACYNFEGEKRKGRGKKKDKNIEMRHKQFIYLITFIFPLRNVPIKPFKSKI